MKPDASEYNPDPEYLRDLIDSTGMTQPYLASLLGVDERTIRKWKTGERKASYLAQFALEVLILEI